MDLFESKNIKPMLIGEMQAAFNSPDYIYELKLDGLRCIAYLDKDATDLNTHTTNTPLFLFFKSDYN